jgi:hypothetical protein
MQVPKPYLALSAILIAAILGAALFDGMIVADNWSYEHGGPDAGFGWVTWMLVIPSAMVAGALNLHELPNPYLVNGALGALIFASIAAFCIALRWLASQAKQQPNESD